MAVKQGKKRILGNGGEIPVPLGKGKKHLLGSGGEIPIPFAKILGNGGEVPVPFAKGAPIAFSTNMSTSIPFTSIVKGDAGNAGSGSELITTEARYREWMGLGKNDVIKGINFKTEAAIAVTPGMMNTGGYKVKVTAIVRMDGGFMGGHMFVHYEVISPSGLATQVFTHPCNIVTVKKTDIEGVIAIHFSLVNK